MPWESLSHCISRPPSSLRSAFCKASVCSTSTLIAACSRAITAKSISTKRCSDARCKIWIAHFEQNLENRNYDLHAASCFERVSQSSTDRCTARAFSRRCVHIDGSSRSVYLCAGDPEFAKELGVILPSGADVVVVAAAVSTAAAATVGLECRS